VSSGKLAAAVVVSVVVALAIGSPVAAFIVVTITRLTQAVAGG